MKLQKTLVQYFVTNMDASSYTDVMVLPGTGSLLSIARVERRSLLENLVLICARNIFKTLLYNQQIL